MGLGIMENEVPGWASWSFLWITESGGGTSDCGRATVFVDRGHGVGMGDVPNTMSVRSLTGILR